MVCDSQVVFELAAFALQAESGDYKNEEATQEKLREMSWLPGRTLKEHVSISYWFVLHTFEDGFVASEFLIVRVRSLIIIRR